LSDAGGRYFKAINRHAVVLVNVGCPACFDESRRPQFDRRSLDRGLRQAGCCLDIWAVHRATMSEEGEYPREHEDCYLLGGTDGSLAIPTLTHVRNEKGGGRADPFIRKELFYVPANPWVEELLHFADVIRGRAQSMIDAEDGTRTLAAVLAVMRSAEEQRPVSIGEML